MEILVVCIYLDLPPKIFKNSESVYQLVKEKMNFPILTVIFSAVLLNFIHFSYSGLIITGGVNSNHASGGEIGIGLAIGVGGDGNQGGNGVGVIINNTRKSNNTTPTELL